MNEFGSKITDLLAIIVGLFLVIIAAVWVIFPFVVNSALARIQKLLASQNRSLEDVSGRLNETNKALQWIIDNWKERG